MSRVRSKETRIEVEFRDLLSGRKFRYRKNNAKHFGNPDIIFVSKKMVVFIDSCFWHGCRYHFRLPKQNREYWVKKINRNRERDREVNRYYKKINWTMVRIWEHSLKNSEFVSDKIKVISEGYSK